MRVTLDSNKNDELVALRKSVKKETKKNKKKREHNTVKNVKNEYNIKY